MKARLDGTLTAEPKPDQNVFAHTSPAPRSTRNEIGVADVPIGGDPACPGEPLAPEHALDRVAGDDPLSDPVQPECEGKLDICSLVGAQRPGTIAPAMLRDVSDSQRSILSANSPSASRFSVG